MGVKKVYYSWEDINNLLDNIYEQCKENINYVTGVPRGGTILAILYSHRFNIPYMEWRSNHYPDLLIIDDISDSGKTFKDLKKELPNPKYAALHFKDTSEFEPDYYAKKIPDEYGWIVYPWEKEDSKPIQDYLDN
jgi:hypoxanthine phosphoribosyltransferase